MPEIDAFQIIQDSINSIKSDINSLADKYYDSVRDIWIKLTELEAKMKIESDIEKNKSESWYKSLSIIASILAILLSMAGLFKDAISKAITK